MFYEKLRIKVKIKH